MAHNNLSQDTNYLIGSIGNNLAEALARVAVVQPSDPVDYLGRMLLQTRENELRNIRRNNEKTTVESQKLEAAKARENARQDAIRREKAKAVKRAAQYLEEVREREKSRHPLDVLLSIARDISGGDKNSAAVRDGVKIVDKWVADVEAGSYDPAARPAVSAENPLKVDENHALFRVVRSVLVLLGYKEENVAHWKDVEKLVKKAYFTRQLELFRPDLIDPKARALRLAKAAAGLSELQFAQLHSAPLVGTVMYEYLRTAANVHNQLASQENTGVSVDISAAAAVGAQNAAVRISGADPRAKSAEHPEDVFPLPGVNTRVIDRALSSAVVEFVVTWSCLPEPKAPTPPPAAANPAPEQLDEEDEEEEEEKPKKKKGKDSKKEEKSSKKSKKSKKKDDSDEEEEGDGDAEDRNAGKPKRTAQWEPDVDLCCTMLDAYGSIADLVYFARLHSKNGAIGLTEYQRQRRNATNKFVVVKGKKVAVKDDEAALRIPVNTEIFSLDFSRVPANVTTLAFSVSANVPGESFEHLIVIDGHLRPKAGGSSAVHVRVPGGINSNAAVLALFHRSNEDPSQWVVRAVCDPLPRQPPSAGQHSLQTLPVVHSYLSEFGIGNYLNLGSGAQAPKSLAAEANPHDLAPGQGFYITQDDISVGLGWTTVSGKPAFGLETTATLYDGNDQSAQVNPDNTATEDNTLIHSGADVASLTPGDNARISVALGSLAKSASTVVFTASVVEEDFNIRDVTSLFLRVVDNDSGKELCRLSLSGAALSGASADSGSVLLAKITRKRDGWECVAVSQVCEGRSVGELSEQIEPVLAPTWGPAVQLAPGDFYPVNGETLALAFGYNYVLPSTAPGAPKPNKAAGFHVVDTSVAIFYEGRYQDLVTKDKIKSNDKAIIHSGDAMDPDNRDESDNEGENDRFNNDDDDEDNPLAGLGKLHSRDIDKVNINFLKLNEKVSSIVFTAKIREDASRNNNFADMDYLFVRVIDEENNKKEVLRFNFTPNKLLTQSNTVVMFKLLRESNGSWVAQALGVPLALKGVEDIPPFFSNPPSADMRGNPLESSDINRIMAPSMASYYAPREMVKGLPYALHNSAVSINLGLTVGSETVDRILESEQRQSAIYVEAGVWVFNAQKKLIDTVAQAKTSSDNKAIEKGFSKGISINSHQSRYLLQDTVRLNLANIDPNAQHILVNLLVHEQNVSLQNIDEIQVYVENGAGAHAQRVLEYYVKQHDYKKTKTNVLLRLMPRDASRTTWIVSPVNESLLSADPHELELQLEKLLDIKQ